MSSNYNQYGGYGGNPYGGEPAQSNPYGSSNPYGGTQTQPGYNAGNPYGGNTAYGQQQQQPPQSLRPPQPAAQHHDSSYSAQSQYSQHGYDGNNDPSRVGAQQGYDQSGYGQAGYGQPGYGQQNVEYVQAGPPVLSDNDFLAQVEAIKKSIRELTTNVDNIASLHQQSLNSTDTRGSAPLESLVTNTQVKTTMIREQIKKLEVDAARSRGNKVKDTQIKQLKTSFTNQLQLYRQEEAKYEQRYREQIARQYRIVNPQATDAEVAEATQADWGNEGVFQTALRSNRSATANTVLGSVRARHNDIQKIERTMIELNQIMQDLATTIVLQESAVIATEGHTTQVATDTSKANDQLNKGIASAKRARRNKWICFWIVVAVIVILAAILGGYFGTMASRNNNNGGR